MHRNISGLGQELDTHNIDKHNIDVYIYIYRDLIQPARELDTHHGFILTGCEIEGCVTEVYERR